MKAQRKTLVGYLGRCLCCTICVIVAVGTAWQLRPDWFGWIPNGWPRQPPVHRQRIRNPAELIAKIDERLGAERNRISAITESLTRMRNLRNSLNAQVEEKQKVLADRRDELQQYSALVNEGEGLILSSGEYVSATTVRNRAVERRTQFSELDRQLEQESRMAINVSASLESAESQLTNRQREVDQLKHLRDGLAEKTGLLSRLEAAKTQDDLSDSSMASLRTAVESMQDVIDIRLEMLDEESEIEQALGLASQQQHPRLE